MKSKWFKDGLTRIPEEFERLNKKQWIQRVNVQAEEVPTGAPEDSEEPQTMTMYTCDARILSNEEHDALLDTLYTPAQNQNQKSFSAIEQNQAVGDDDRVSLMEAMADLFELVMSIQGGEE